MDKKIKFIALNKEEFDLHVKPCSASNSIPDWWKNMSPYNKTETDPEGKKLSLSRRISSASFKKCTPMLDSITSGYIISLWADVLVSIENGYQSISWKTEHDVFQPHGSSSHIIPPPPGYTNQVVKYVNTWVPKTPNGYSCVVSSPVGFNDLPFKAIPGIVDTDKSVIEFASPMWLKEGFTGVVEKGTPLVQITPFKRESWKAEYEYYKEGEHKQILESTFNSTIVNHYRKNVWSRKEYR
jgi:hypothetical protein